MGYEVDFLGVGCESKSGDAIAIRFGNLHGRRDEQTVVVIDGGSVISALNWLGISALLIKIKPIYINCFFYKY